MSERESLLVELRERRRQGARPGKKKQERSLGEEEEDATELKLLSQTALPDPPASGGAGMGMYSAQIMGVAMQTWLVTGFLLVWSDQYIIWTALLLGVALLIKVVREVASLGMKGASCSNRVSHFVLFAIDLFFWTAIMAAVIIFGLWAAPLFVWNPAYATIAIILMLTAIVALLMWASMALVL